MMRITHASSQWAELCAALCLDADVATGSDVLNKWETVKRLNRLPRVYVAGPYTQGDVAQNVRAAILCGDWLAERGCVPFVPHLSHFAHLLCPRPYEYWIEQDLAWLRVCDALVRLPGESQGAEIEVTQAQVLGLPVFEAAISLSTGAPTSDYGAWIADRGGVSFAEWREGWGK